MSVTTYETAGGIRVQRTVEDIPLPNAIEPVIHALDTHRGVLLASSYEYPGRYTRWDMGFVDPPLVLVTRGRSFRIEALNDRGRVLLPPIAEALRGVRGRGDGDGDGRGAGRRGAASRPAASPRRSAAGSPRCSRSSACSTVSSSIARSRISVSTARSATTWPSSSSRSACACRVPRTSAT